LGHLIAHYAVHHRPLVATSGSGEDKSLQKCCQLLKQYPKLASKRYRRNDGCFVGRYQTIFPLCFLLELGASLEMIREIYQLYPQAVSQPVHVESDNDGNHTKNGNHHDNHTNHRNNKNPPPQQRRTSTTTTTTTTPTTSSRTTEFPLHVACLHGRVAPEVVIFLVHAFADAILVHDRHGKTPLHLLLWTPHRSATVPELEAMVHYYPECVTTPGPCFGTPVFLALKRRHVPENVQELHFGGRPIRTTIAPNERTTATTTNSYILDNSRNSSNNHHRLRRHDKKFAQLKYYQAQALVPLFSQLHTLTCTPNEWDPRAFEYVMTHMTHASCTLRDVTLYMPPSLLFRGTAATTNHIKKKDIPVSPPFLLQQLLLHSPCLEHLEIDFGYHDLSSFPYSSHYHHNNNNNREVAAYLQHGLKPCLHNILQGLVGSPTSTSSSSMSSSSLSSCCRLKTLHLRGGGMERLASFFKTKFWPPLIDNLERHNTTLQVIVMDNVNNHNHNNTVVDNTHYRNGDDDSDSHNNNYRDAVLSSPLKDSPSQQQQLQLRLQEQVFYWTQLNRYGRARVRNPQLTMVELVHVLEGILLSTVQDDDDDEKETVVKKMNKEKMGRITWLYGLLQECPGLWSEAACSIGTP